MTDIIVCCMDGFHESLYIYGDMHILFDLFGEVN